MSATHLVTEVVLADLVGVPLVLREKIPWGAARRGPALVMARQANPCAEASGSEACAHSAAGLGHRT